MIKDSQEVIKKLSALYEIYIVTAAMEFPASLAPKYRWLKQHFSFLNEKHFVFCGDKSIIQADYLTHPGRILLPQSKAYVEDECLHLIRSHEERLFQFVI